MDDLIEGLVGSILGIALALTIGLVVGAGWLLFKFCEAVLPPLCEWLGSAIDRGWRRAYTWWRNVTWRWRAKRAHRKALHEIGAARDGAVAQARMLVAELDRLEMPTADKTAAVRTAVRPAVRSR